MQSVSTMSATPTPHPHHPSQLDPREPPPPPASASDSDRHHHPHTGIVGLGIGMSGSGTGSGTATPSHDLSPGRTRKTSHQSGPTMLGHGTNHEPAVSSPLQQEQSSLRSGSPAQHGEGNYTSLAKSFSPGSSPLHSRASSPAPPALSAHNSSLLSPGGRRSSTPAAAPEPVNHHRVRDDFIGVITPGSRTPVGSNSVRGSFGTGNSGATPNSHLNVDSLKHEMKALQDGMSSSDPFVGTGTSAIDEDDEYGVKEPLPMHMGSPGRARSTSPVLDLLPRGSTLLPHSPSASSIQSNDHGARTLGEAGEGIIGSSLSRHTVQMSPRASSTGLDSARLQKRASVPHIQAGSMSMSMSTPNSPSASAIFERDIESPFAIALPGASPSVTNSPVPGGAGTGLQRDASRRASRSSSAAPPRSPTPRRGVDSTSRSTPTPQAFINAAALPPYMHDSSDRHVPTVLDDAVEALTHSGSQALQIEAPVNAYISSRELGNRSPFGAVHPSDKAGGSRSPSPMRWKDLGKTGGDPTGRAGSRSASPLPSPTREKRALFPTQSETESGGHVFSLNDDDAQHDSDKVVGSRPTMQTRQSSLGMLIPGAFPSARSQQEHEVGGRKWKKKIGEWIGPRPNALLAGSDELAETERGTDVGAAPDEDSTPTRDARIERNELAAAPQLPSHLNPEQDEPRRISFYTYDDMLQSRPITINPLSDITSGTVEPEHLPTQLETPPTQDVVRSRTTSLVERIVNEGL